MWNVMKFFVFENNRLDIWNILWDEFVIKKFIN